MSCVIFMQNDNRESCAQNDYVGQNYQNEAVLGLCDEDVSILFEDTSSCINDL